MLRPDIDPAAIREHLATHGRVQIGDFLVPEAAERLHRCLDEEVPWALAIGDADGSRMLSHEQASAMTAQQQRALFAELAESARGEAYRFAYDSYMMTRAYVEGRDPGLFLHRVLEFLNSPPYLAFARAFTGEERIRRVSAQATRYRPGQFLRTHNDEDSGTLRLYAYVLNLTRHWQADWGGLLQFVSEDGAVTDTLMPRWNSLSVFRVPVRHTVSMVMPWAGERRMAVTGWMLGTAPA